MFMLHLKSFTELPFKNYFKKPAFLGLDIGCQEIRLLQLEKRGTHLHIEKILAHPLLTKMDSGEGFFWEQNQDPFFQFIEQLKLKGSSVAFALPSSAIIKKTIELPSSIKEKELTEEV